MKTRTLIVAILFTPFFVGAATLTHSLSLGMSGSDVTALQQILQTGGYLSVAPTGYFGSLTQTAVEQYQSAKGIVSSGDPATTGYGAVGPKTLASLNGTSNPNQSLIDQLLAEVKALEAQIAAILAGQGTTGGSVAGSPATITSYTPPSAGGGGGGGASSGSSPSSGGSSNGGGTTTPPPETTPPSSGSGVTDAYGTTWYPLKIGAGGFLTGFSVSSDGTMVVRTDTYGAYIWNPNATSPTGNAGGTGAWQQLVTASSMPANFTAHAQLYAAGVFEIQVAPNNSNVMYMVYPVYIPNQYPPMVGVYKSTNKGATWTQTSFAPLNAQVMDANGTYRMWDAKMAINPTNPNNVYVGTPANGMFVTADGGSTWSTVSGVPVATGNQGITGIVFQPGSSNVIFAASYGNGVYKTTNGGSTWAKLAGGPSSVEHVAISTTGTYYVIDATDSVWEYSSSWSEILPANGAQGIYPSGVAVDPFNANHVVVTLYQGVLDESLNGGSTWSGWSENFSATFGAGRPTYSALDIPYQALFGTDANGLHFDPVASGKLYINGDRGFWTTTLAGNMTTATKHTWTDQSVGIEQLVANDIISTQVSNSTPIVAAWDSAVFTPNLATYATNILPDSSLAAGWSLDYASSNPNFIAVLADGTYAGGPQKTSYSTDAGRTWNPMPSMPFTTFGGNIAVSTPTNFIVGSQNTQPYYTTNGGTSWNAISLPGVSSWSGFIGPFFVSSRAIAADRVLSNTFYLLFPGKGFYKSTNSGTTWSLVSSALPASIGTWSQVKTTPRVAGDIWISSGTSANAGSQSGSSGGPLMHSTDGGATWTAIANVSEPYAVGFGAPPSGQTYPSVYIVGWVNNIYGIWRSTDQGVSWTQVGQWPLGSLDTIKTISGDANVFGRVYVGFSGSGFIYGDNTSGSVAPPSDTTPPTVTITAPSGQLAAGTTQTTLSVTTSESATCAYSATAGTAFVSMTPFTTTGNTSHSTTLSGLSNGSSYTMYVKCKDVSGNISTDSSTSYSVAASQAAQASYSFNGAASTDPSGTTGTFAGLNLGSGSVYCILGINIQNAPAISGVTVNGAPMSAVDAISADGNVTTIWSGPCTVTGSDSVVVTTATSMGFADLDLVVWTARGLVSNTPVSHTTATGYSISSSAPVGSFVFVLSSSASNFNSSTQPPSGSHPATGLYTAPLGADWTASAGGISGGNFTATSDTFSDLVMAVWH